MAGSIALDSTAQASFKKSLENLLKSDKVVKEGRIGKPKRGVVYITHIPHGFYEEQMKGYFSQFGTVTNVKLARSKKSGKSKGFAFIEFEHAEVAQVVAETMNNYIMCNRLLKAEYIPHERMSGKNFWRTNVTARSYPRLRNRKKNILAKNTDKSEEKVGMLLRKRHKHVESIIEKLNVHGISYSLRGFDIPVKTTMQPPTPVLEIDESDEEIEFRIRPDFTLKKKILKKSKKTSNKKAKTDSNKTGVVMNEKCKSPEPKLHLMNVKKNLFGNYENSSPETGGNLLEEDVNVITALPTGVETPVHPLKSTRKATAVSKTETLIQEPSPPHSTSSKAKTPKSKSVKHKGKKMAEKFSARLQKKLKRRATKQKDVGVSESTVDKFAKKLKVARKSSSLKTASNSNRNKFSSKKLSLKGKMQAFVEWGV